MKSIEKQIEFIDKKILPIFGVKNITDYQKNICLDNIDNLVLQNLNNIIKEFRDIFPVKDFSLHKTNYIIKTTDHAFNFLKKMLDISCVPYELNKNNGKKIMRLLPENKILINYIKNMEKTSDIRENEKIFYIDNGLNKYSGVYDYDDLINNIKKTNNMSIGVYLKNLKSYNLFYEIDLSQYGLHNKNISEITISRIDVESGKTINSQVNANTFNLSEEEYNEYEHNYFAISFDSQNASHTQQAKYVCGNIVFSGWIILNSCHDQHEKVRLGIQKIPQDKKKNIMFKIDIKHVDFYTDFEKKIKTSYIDQKFPYILNAKVITANNYSTIVYCADDIHNTNKKTPKINDIKTSNLSDIPEGTYEKFGNYEVYIMHENDSVDNMLLRMVGANSKRLQPNLVYAIEPYKIYLEKYNYINCNDKKNITFYKCHLNKNVLLNRCNDFIYEMSIKSPNELNLNTTTLYLKYQNITHHLNLECIGNTDGKYTYTINTINKRNMIKVLPMTLEDNGLYIESQSNTLANNLIGCTIELKCCVADVAIRKQFYNENALFRI